jgi:hypothetical protein
VGESLPLNKRKGKRMPRYDFQVTKTYQVTADSKEEALEMINSPQEYDYLVDEEWGEVVVNV